jgi:CheY-like chemotaxis protein
MKSKWLSETNNQNVMEAKMLKPLNFRYALVIEEIESFRASIVNALRAQGWLVHGIPRAEQAFDILARIPYNLVVIDSELPGIGGIDFVRILHNSRERRTIRLVIIASSQSVDFATQAAEYGAFLARKSRWKSDLLSFLSGYDEDPTDNTVCDQRVDSPPSQILPR